MTEDMTEDISWVSITLTPTKDRGVYSVRLEAADEVWSAVLHVPADSSVWEQARALAAQHGCPVTVECPGCIPARVRFTG